MDQLITPNKLEFTNLDEGEVPLGKLFNSSDSTLSVAEEADSDRDEILGVLNK